MKKNKYYICIAYRFGSNENHSYPIGVFSKKSEAIKSAEKECDQRGGKYHIWVFEYDLDVYDIDNPTGKIVYKTE